MDEELENQYEEEVYAQDQTSSPDDLFFDEVSNALQEFIFGGEFDACQSEFVKKHCLIFQHDEENKLEYMEIFKLYQQEFETMIQQYLKQNVANFQMERFTNLLKSHSKEIDDQILQIIGYFSDFMSFKKMMLDYKDFMKNEADLKGIKLQSKRIG